MNEFTIYIGDSVEQLLQVQLNGLPYDLTDLTEIQCSLNNDPDESSEATQTLLYSEGDFEVVEALAGTFNLLMNPAETEILKEQDKVNLDLFIQTTGAAVLTTTGNTVVDSTTLSGLASTTGLRKGQLITGTGIPANTYVEDISGNTVTMSNAATATGTAVAVVLKNRTTKTFRIPNGLSVVQRTP